MRFLLDANMPRAALRVLIAAGHPAAHVRDLGMGAATDAVIDHYAQALCQILVTRDLDFADIRAYPLEPSAGRVVLRLPDSSRADEIADLLRRFLAESELIQQIPGHLVVLEQDRIRFRPALVAHES